MTAIPEAPRTRTGLRQRLLTGLLFQLDNGVPDAGGHLLALLREWPDMGPESQADARVASPPPNPVGLAYEDIGPWHTTGGNCVRVDQRGGGVTLGRVAVEHRGVVEVWDDAAMDWEIALSREAANARLRELYPPHVSEAPRQPPRGHPDLGVGPTCPTCGGPTHRKLSGIWLCRVCPNGPGARPPTESGPDGFPNEASQTCADPEDRLAEVQSLARGVLGSEPANGAVQVLREEVEGWAKQLVTDIETWLLEYRSGRVELGNRVSALEARLDPLLADRLEALEDRHSVLAVATDERFRAMDRPAGPIAPPLGDHVEAVAARRAVVAWLRISGDIEALEESAAAMEILEELAAAIEAGAHLPVSSPVPAPESPDTLRERARVVGLLLAASDASLSENGKDYFRAAAEMAGRAPVRP